MDFSRIRSAMDVSALQIKLVTVFGAGASVGLITDLTRCGIRRWTLVDPDVVAIANPVRQDHDPKDVGLHKVDAVRQLILRVNPAAEVQVIPADCTGLDDETSKATFSGTDLFIAATDSFRCQAYVNRLALMTEVPAVLIGIYAGGLGGEVVWIDPLQFDCCFRCLCSSRYKAQEEAAKSGKTLDPPSDGADVFSVRIPDAIAGQLIVGLLTQGAPNRYGRLIEQMGQRQFIQIALSPEFQVNGRDVVRAELDVPNDNNAYFTWNSITLADPDKGQLPCPDCQAYRSHEFEKVEGRWQRRKRHQEVIAEERTDNQPVTL